MLFAVGSDLEHADHAAVHDVHARARLALTKDHLPLAKLADSGNLRKSIESPSDPPERKRDNFSRFRLGFRHKVSPGYDLSHQVIPQAVQWSFNPQPQATVEVPRDSRLRLGCGLNERKICHLNRGGNLTWIKDAPVRG